MTLDIREADIEQCELESEAYDLLVCFYYLQRTVFPQIKRALRHGGALVFETFTIEQLQLASGPRNPAHLLNPNELCHAFRNLRVSYYRERVRGGKAVASLVASKISGKAS